MIGAKGKQEEDKGNHGNHHEVDLYARFVAIQGVDIVSVNG